MLPALPWLVKGNSAVARYTLSTGCSVTSQEAVFIFRWTSVYAEFPWPALYEASQNEDEESCDVTDY